jgi:hypothetical protein
VKEASPVPKACPSCRKSWFRPGDVAWDWMWEREDHHEILNWQCVNCGAFIHKGVHQLEIVRFGRIILAPGELAGLRISSARKGLS